METLIPLGPEYRDLPLTRASVPALDALIGKMFRVGKYGWVRVIDYMGNDISVVEAARQSYGEGTRPLTDDRGLLRYLVRNWHTTPVEMAVVKVHVRLPIYVARQWMRTRMASYNEYSLRYSEALPYIEETGEGAFRLQSTKNKQGSEGLTPEEVQGAAAFVEGEAFDSARRAYTYLLEEGVAREQARKVLPLAQYTEFVFKVDLHNLMHFLLLRLDDDHAQGEIVEFAQVLAEVMQAWVPLTWEAFVDYRLKALTLSRLDVEVMKALISGNWLKGVHLAEEYGWLKQVPGDAVALRPVRERLEFEVKMARLGVSVPWWQKEAA